MPADGVTSVGHGQRKTAQKIHSGGKRSQGRKPLSISPSLLSDATQTLEGPHQHPDVSILFATLLPSHPDLRPAGAHHLPEPRHLDVYLVYTSLPALISATTL